MARQQSQSKGLYYPTPLAVVDLIAAWIGIPATPGLRRLADPCVGEGEALAHLSQALATAYPKQQTWGVELSPDRADKATHIVDVVLPTSFYTVSQNNLWAPKSVSLLFNNAPYDWSNTSDETGRKIRHEVLFATQATAKLLTGGLHLLLVPQWVLADATLARHWTGWY